MDIVRLMLVLATLATIRVARAEELPVVVGSGDSLPPAAEGGSMACRVMSQESVIGEWIRQVRETNDVSLAFDSIVSLGYLHRADWDGANEFLKETCKDVRTLEGMLAVELQKRRIQCLQMANEHLVRNLSGCALVQELRGACVISASCEGVLIHRADHKIEQRVSWMKVYKDCYKEYIGWVNRFLVKRNKCRMPLIEWTKTMTGAILTMKLLSVDNAYVADHVERWVKEVVKAFPDYQRDIDAMITGLVFHIDKSNPRERMYANAWMGCGGDTGRFVHRLYELTPTNETRLADGLIRCLGVYGTSAQLPFLYSMVTNEQHGATAVKSILRLEGVTSNSVDVTGMYLSMTNVDFEYRADACKALLRAAAPSCVTTGICQMARNCALRYARSANRYVMDVDAVFIETDSTYRNSKRRLAVLRSAYGLGVSQYQIAYVTNAINELVAYPEADLPE